jgi:hypothetical protein
MTVFHFLLLSLASFRVTRLITTDDITQPLRDRLPDNWLAELLSCSWCCGVWVTAVLFAADHYLTIPLVILAAVAAMSVVGYLGTWDKR